MIKNNYRLEMVGEPVVPYKNLLRGAEKLSWNWWLMQSFCSRNYLLKEQNNARLNGWYAFPVMEQRSRT